MAMDLMLDLQCVDSSPNNSGSDQSLYSYLYQGAPVVPKAPNDLALYFWVTKNSITENQICKQVIHQKLAF